jgi:hypothetical protein
MKARIIISVACVGMAVLHRVFPNVTVDATTTVLILVAILPWLSSVIKSLELPGGFKIELHDVQAATAKIAPPPPAAIAEPPSPAALLPALPPRQQTPLDYLRALADTDPSLALVGLRIELERRLNALAQAADMPATRRSAGILARDLADQRLLDRRTAAGLSELIGLGNRAAHGAEVSTKAAVWALDAAPPILDMLETLAAQPGLRIQAASESSIRAVTSP